MEPNYFRVPIAGPLNYFPFSGENNFAGAVSPGRCDEIRKETQAVCAICAQIHQELRALDLPCPPRPNENLKSKNSHLTSLFYFQHSKNSCQNFRLLKNFGRETKGLFDSSSLLCVGYSSNMGRFLVVMPASSQFLRRFRRSVLALYSSDAPGADYSRKFPRD